MILVDSNVIIDVINREPEWMPWSLDQIARNAARRRTLVNEIVLAEVAPAMGSLLLFYQEIGALGIGFESISDEAAFVAGEAFRTYRMTKLGGNKSILADFLIGGHAEALGATILTRDPRFYRSYFPKVPIIAPSKDEND